MVHVPVHTLRALNTATMLMPFRSVISLRAAVQSAILGGQNDKGIDSALLLDVTLCGLWSVHSCIASQDVEPIEPM
jgi:hypothetical protein